jgi:hypothetical protein
MHTQQSEVIWLKETGADPTEPLRSCPVSIGQLSPLDRCAVWTRAGLNMVLIGRHDLLKAQDIPDREVIPGPERTLRPAVAVTV